MLPEPRAESAALEAFSLPEESPFSFSVKMAFPLECFWASANSCSYASSLL